MNVVTETRGGLVYSNLTPEVEGVLMSYRSQDTEGYASYFVVPEQDFIASVPERLGAGEIVLCATNRSKRGVVVQQMEAAGLRQQFALGLMAISSTIHAGLYQELSAAERAELSVVSSSIEELTATQPWYAIKWFDGALEVVPLSDLLVVEYTELARFQPIDVDDWLTIYDWGQPRLLIWEGAVRHYVPQLDALAHLWRRYKHDPAWSQEVWAITRLVGFPVKVWPVHGRE